ncbi:hypothetical protein [Eggerthella timonensis]|uniref:hypothetical protein n=1 Tax=Eggerthella timonensis TaxID=1871008 RepID=UPI000C756D9C|nr:hypothetical protein [Eggerthella timonensis]
MKRKMFAALALSATLAMGAAPAFAAEPADTGATDAGGFTGNAATTTVSIKTDASQISAEIPMKVQIVANAAGGAITSPTADAYKITNKSSFDIYVTKISGAAVDASKWTLENAINDINNTPKGSIGDIALGVKKDGADDATKVVVGSEQKITGDTMKMTSAPAADAGTTTHILGLDVSGTTTKVKSVSDTATEAVKITYTISAQPEKAPVV